MHTITTRPYPYCPVTLGDYLRKRRLDLNLTKKQLAEDILRTSTSNIRNWEANRRQVSLQFRPEIDKFIGVCPLDVSIPRLGLRLRERREHFGLSIKKMSRLLQADPSTIAGWEKGDHEPAKQFAQKIKYFLKSYGYE